jgi:serine/threonine-protein kinase
LWQKKHEPDTGNKEFKKCFYNNFLDEIKILYKLNHKNIVRIYNYYAYEEIFTGYILMEYIDGQNISDFISEYNIPFAIVTLDNIFIQLIDGFNYIENHGIIIETYAKIIY